MLQKLHLLRITGIVGICILIFVYLRPTQFWIQIRGANMTARYERLQVSSYCETSKRSTPDVFSLICLKNMTIEKLSNDPEMKPTVVTRSMPVPNVVHYIWFGANRKFTFIQYLSFRSVHIHLAPNYIFLHGNYHPRRGHWWRKTLGEVSNLYFVDTVQPHASPSGLPWHFIEHSTDFARIQLLIDYGGIYLDTDIVVLKSFDTLRKYPMVMGRETETQINSGILLAKRHSPFLRMWLETYTSYLGEVESWAGKATYVPNQLAEIYPHLIHVEETSLNQPNWGDLYMLYTEEYKYNWTNNYAVHVWQKDIHEDFSIPQGPRDVAELNTTLGEISRYILYGSKDMRSRV